VGEEPNHVSARKPGPLYIIQYSLVPVDNAEDLIYGRFTLLFPPNSLTEQRTNITVNVVITVLYLVHISAGSKREKNGEHLKEN
jgi:hypothetical protein